MSVSISNRIKVALACPMYMHAKNRDGHVEFVMNMEEPVYTGSEDDNH